MINNDKISDAMSVKLEEIFKKLPQKPVFAPNIRRAPKRNFSLSQKETILALKNALRYIPEKWHNTLAPEFLNELLSMGRIYGYRFMPKSQIRGMAIEKYKGKCIEAKAFQVMIDNNLDTDIALYP